VDISFDPSNYVRPPVLSVASGFALATALLSACPKSVTPELRNAARRLRKATLELQTQWLARDRSSVREDKRPADQRVDNGWSALERRVDAYSWLPQSEYPLATRAAELHQLMFPRGLTFLTLPYPEEWAEGEKLLRTIEENNLEADLNKIAGPEFLTEVRAAHHVYGAALGVTRATEAPVDVSLAAPLRTVQRAIVNYAVKLVAMADEEDESTMTMVRAALAPIDAHRAAMARRTSPAEPPAPVDPNSPVPDVPAPPA